jgi:uncharacterized protein (TIGR03492 family)
MRLLCISNGHGEDVIAIAILQALQSLAPELILTALPIVGTGELYHQQAIPLVGATKALPSGGFLNMDTRQLARDLKGGLIGLTWAQIKAVRTWAKGGGMILAVGDIVPLLFGFGSGVNYAFVGTAKSDYYWRDELGVLPKADWWRHWSRSDYFPWERWLMRHARCRCVFVRDTITATGLKQWPIRAFDAGNPMMDGFNPSMDPSMNPCMDYSQDRNGDWPESAGDELAPLTVCLLPGSRVPEAYENWRLMVQAIENVMQVCQNRGLVFLAAVAPGLALDVLAAILLEQGWQMDQQGQYVKAKARLAVSRQDFVGFLQRGQVAIAMAGTATEQFVGLGKPVITLPGAGPQFTATFAQRQTRLLGVSVTLVANPSEVGDAVVALLSDPDRLAQIYQNGRHRLGPPGAAQRIAATLLAELA